MICPHSSALDAHEARRRRSLTTFALQFAFPLPLQYRSPGERRRVQLTAIYTGSIAARSRSHMCVVVKKEVYRIQLCRVSWGLGIKVLRIGTGVPLLYYPDLLFVTTQTVNMLLTVCQGGHHRPVVVNKVLTTEKCVNSKRRSVALC